MTVTGAVIREQGVTFGVIAVKLHVVQSDQNTLQMIEECQRLDVFAGIPIVLMAQDSRGEPIYNCLKRDSDIAKFLASIFVERIPWKRYTFR